MIGGKPTAKSAGLTVTYRDEIYNKISSIPEGELFRADVITQDADHLADDFTTLRDHDYLHVVDGWLTGIVETKYLRRSPKLSLVLSSYKEIMDCDLVPTGDRTAYEMGYRQWEPLQGYRFYTDGESRLLTIGALKVRIIHAPEWIRDLSEVGQMLRVLYDTPEKEIPETVARMKASGKVAQEDFEKVHALATSISNDHYSETLSSEFRDPTQVTSLVMSYLTQKKDHKS